jgi:putative ATP-binding cassette transporter
LKTVPNDATKQPGNFDKRLWRRFWNIAKPYWFLDEKWTARGLLLILVFLLLGRTEFIVVFNQQSGEFTSALAVRDGTRFWHSMRVFGGVLVAAVPIYALYYYVRDRIGVSWRRWLTHHLLEKYFKNRAYYALSFNPAIDNPDQRIADDINTFTQKSLMFLLEAVGAVLRLVAFSALDGENEESLYLRLKDSPSTLVSVAHRPTLLKYHANVLEVGHGGTWRLIQASRYRFVD